LLVLQQLLASELSAGLQLRHESHFLRIALRPAHRVLALAEFLLLALQPRQAGHVVGHSATTTTPMMIDITYLVTSHFLTRILESWDVGALNGNPKKDDNSFLCFSLCAIAHR
jgi:hypothetical protein